MATTMLRIHANVDAFLNGSSDDILGKKFLPDSCSIFNKSCKRSFSRNYSLGQKFKFCPKKVKLSFFALKKLGPSKSKNSCNAHIAIKIKLLVLEIEKLFSKLDVLKIFY